MSQEKWRKAIGLTGNLDVCSGLNDTGVGADAVLLGGCGFDLVCVGNGGVAGNQQVDVLQLRRGNGEHNVLRDDMERHGGQY
jgi:hypothetical protein